MNERIVTKMPLVDLWNASGPISAERVRYLEFDDVRDLLRRGPITFVVADIGQPLTWIELNECFEFWKKQARSRIATPDRVHLEDYPGEYCFVASEWFFQEVGGMIVLEKSH